MKTIELITVYAILLAVVIFAWHYSKHRRQQLYKSFKARQKFFINTLGNKYNNSVASSQIIYSIYNNDGTKIINLDYGYILLNKFQLANIDFTENKDIKLPVKDFQSSMKSFKRNDSLKEPY